MRDAYHEQLDSVGCTLRRMADLVAVALARATWALLEADLPVAESVIAADDAVDALHRDLDARAVELIARQQPVAGDLRTLVASLRMSAEIERMGDLAGHIAKVARMRYPQSAIPPHLRNTFEQMGRIGVRLAGQVGQIIEGKDVHAAEELELEDDTVDRLHRTVLTQLLEAEPDTETAIDVTLVSRYYERFADHAVKVADRLIFLVTGASGARLAGSARDLAA
jgi:phosphate transport system protein